MNWKPIKSVDFLIVHASATSPDHDIGAQEIRRWHRERGWFDIGYHYVIRRDGVLETGRKDTRPGAHVRGFNHRSLGICLVGGVDKKQNPQDNYTDEQYETLGRILTELSQRHPDAEVLGHRDMPNVHKACPCFEVRDFWNGYKAH